MRIRNFSHKGLKRLYDDNDPKGVPAAGVDKLRKIFAFLDAMENIEELRSVPTWRPHLLLGDRKGDMELTRHTKLASDLLDRRRRE